MVTKSKHFEKWPKPYLYCTKFSSNRDDKSLLILTADVKTVFLKSQIDVKTDF